MSRHGMEDSVIRVKRNLHETEADECEFIILVGVAIYIERTSEVQSMFSI